MPELPEVEMFKKYLDSTALNQKIVKVEVKNVRILKNVSAAELEMTLEGRQFLYSMRHGKYLFVNAGDIWVLFHFGMTGWLKYFNDLTDDPVHDRLLMKFENGYYLAFVGQRMFERVGLTRDVTQFLQSQKIGPDVLQIDFETFNRVLRKRRGIIKNILLNQHVMAGLGNMYADEVLFQTGILPTRKLQDLNENQLQDIFEKIKEILQTAIKLQADYDHFPDFYLTPNRNKKQLCPKDKEPLNQIKISGRTAYFCPQHQK